MDFGKEKLGQLPKDRLRGLKVGLIGLLGLIYLSQLYVTLIQRPSRGDLGLVLDAAARMHAAGNVYDEMQYHTHTKPPLTTLAFIPLSQLPRFWAERVWDLLLLGCFAVFLRWILAVAPKPARAPSLAMLGFLAVACTFNAWNVELTFGQFNLLLLLAAMSAVFLPNRYLGGAAFAFSLLFKPTQIVFVPWIFVFAPEKRKIFAGAVALVSALLLVYGLTLGWDRIVADHLAWWTKAGDVTPIHVLREDNFGLPSLAASLGMPPNYWGVFQILGFAACALYCWIRAKPFEAFGVAAALTLLCSPMAWRYVYVLGFPLVLVAWLRWYEVQGSARKWVGAGLAGYFWLTQIYNPEVLKVPLIKELFPTRSLLWGILTLLVCLALSGRKSDKLRHSVQ